MLTRVWVGIILIAAMPLWCQVNNNPADSAATADTGSDSRMLTPPPVSGEAYPTATASEARSNYLRGGISFSTAYSDNVLGAVNGNVVSDVSYSIWPTIALDETTPRLHSVITYSPGFTFYQRTSSRNEADQNLALDLQYRLSPHVTVSFRDSFHKSSNVFNQPDFGSANPVSGSPQGPTIAVVAPIADMLSNTGSGELTYQFSASGMVGASGNFSNLHYSNPAQVPGLSDSISDGGSAFYSRRLSKKHYIGAQYQYSRFLSYPAGTQSETQTHTVFFFYTLYLNPRLSISLSAGPQHSDVVQSPFTSHSWSPAATASLGWQGQHTSLSGSYSRIVTGGGGLIGAFHSNTASASARRQFAKTWSATAGANYSIYKTLTPLFFLATPGGHTISGTVSVQHQLGQRMNLEAGYTRLHQSYSEIAVVSGAPDTNREWISISYQFTRPLGR